MDKPKPPIHERVGKTTRALFMAANAALFAEQGIAHAKHVENPTNEQRDPIHEAAAFNHMEKKLRDNADHDPNEGKENEEKVG